MFIRAVRARESFSQAGVCACARDCACECACGAECLLSLLRQRYRVSVYWDVQLQERVALGGALASARAGELTCFQLRPACRLRSARPVFLIFACVCNDSRRLCTGHRASNFDLAYRCSLPRGRDDQHRRVADRDGRHRASEGHVVVLVGRARCTAHARSGRHEAEARQQRARFI